MEAENKLEAKYGLLTAVSMVIGQVIGSGIFFKVDDVLRATEGNIYAGLLGFVIVGIAVVLAAISIADYAMLVPKDGGLLAYMEYRYGKKAAALIGWMYLSLFYPLLTAVLFTVSGIYIANLLADFGAPKPGFGQYTLIGLVNLLIFFILNIYRPRSSGLFQQVTTVIKLIPLIIIASLGILSISQSAPPAVTGSAAPLTSGRSMWALVAASFIPIAFAFDGWYIATQISGEIKDSRKNLPRALIVGTVTVLLVYVLYYCGIVFRMDSAQILQLKDAYITEYSRTIASRAGAIVIQLFVIISVLGTANGLLLATIRVPYQFYNLDRARKFLKLGKVSERFKMPLNSAFFALAAIMLYMLVYYFTNVSRYFTAKSYDISAIPVAFIYIVIGALIAGLFSLLKNGALGGNKLTKSVMITVALLGILMVIVGSAVTQNGLSYLIISLIFIIFGYLFFVNHTPKY